MKPHRCEISIGVLTFPPGCPQAAWQRENNTQVFKQQNHWHGHFFFFHGPCPLPTTCNDSLFSNQSYFFIYYSWGHSTEAKISSSVKSWHIHADLSAFFLSFSHTHTHTGTSACVCTSVPVRTRKTGEEKYRFWRPSDYTDCSQSVNILNKCLLLN